MPCSQRGNSSLRSRAALLLALLSVTALRAGEVPVRFDFKKHPSLQAGQALRVDFRLKLQGDFRRLPADVDSEDGFFSFERARVGVQGAFLKHFKYEVEREMRPSKNPWRDVFVNYARFRRAQFQAGKFKLPFGMDQLTPPTKLDFVLRSRIGERLAPGRDVGFMAHGELLGQNLGYQAGVFLHDGENARAKANLPTGRRTFAVRLTGRPLHWAPLSKRWRRLNAGGAFTMGNVPEGMNSLRGRSATLATYFPRLFVNGRRLRLGSELDWITGPVHLKSEFIHVRDQRLAQGVRGEDLPDLTASGWYVSATRPLWSPTTKKRRKNEEPVLEAAVRLEQIRFASGPSAQPPSRSTRAATIFPNRDRAWTFGLTWRPNRFTTFQVNAVRESFDDVQRSPLPGVGLFWTQLCRMQFVL